MESTVSLNILFVFFLSKFNWKVLFFLMLMTSIKSFCLLQNKKNKHTHTHTQTNNNVNTCHYLKMIILNFFYYQIFFRENIKKNLIYFFTGENANNNLMF